MLFRSHLPPLKYYFLLSGNGLIAPPCVQVYADTSTALRCDSATDAPLSMFTTKVAVNESRDVSSAAITASALYELSSATRYAGYKETADLIMASLASSAYRAELGDNQGFLLMHSVGSIPHGNEIDVPLNYADYYFLEALKRKRDME